MLRLTALDRGRVILSESKVGAWTRSDAERFLVEPGDFLVARGNGSKHLVGRGGLVGIVRTDVAYPDTLIRVRVNSSILDPEYLRLVWDSGMVRIQIESAARTTAGIYKINQQDLEAVRLPLPPLGEQHRLVQRADEQLTRVESASRSLHRVRANLGRYRAAVLGAACEGRLVPTEAELARQEGRKFEPATVLLERILAERRARWEADELARLTARGKAPRGGEWRHRYTDPDRVDPAELPRLPTGWTWAALSAIADLKGGITKGQRRREGDEVRPVPYLRVANVQRGYLDLSEVKEIEAPESKIRELLLRPGDVLFNEGGDRDKLGRGWVWQGEISECIHQNHVFRARLYTEDVHPKFLSWYGNSLAQRYFMEEGKQTTNLASINLTKLGALPVPLPPRAEQARIVAEVERRLSALDALEATVELDLRRADRLRQAVLKRAFEGKLVPQDPTDEPASALLERVRVSRNPKNTAKPNRRARPTADATAD